MAYKLLNDVQFKTDPVIFLKNKLDAAKEEKNNAKMLEIQEYVWIMKDFKAKSYQKVDSKTLEGLLHALSANIVNTADDKSETEKKWRTLKKKLDQTKKLIERKQNGENLEPNQLEKIDRIHEIEEELTRLENLV